MGDREEWVCRAFPSLQRFKDVRVSGTLNGGPVGSAGAACACECECGRGDEPNDDADAAASTAAGLSAKKEPVPDKVEGKQASQ